MYCLVSFNMVKKLKSPRDLTIERYVFWGAESESGLFLRQLAQGQGHLKVNFADPMSFYK